MPSVVERRPVASRLASLDEVARLVEVMGEEGAGFFQMVQDPPEDEAAHQRWMIDLAVATGVPFALGATGGPRGLKSLELIDAIAEEAARVKGETWHAR